MYFSKSMKIVSKSCFAGYTNYKSITPGSLPLSPLVNQSLEYAFVHI